MRLQQCRKYGGKANKFMLQQSNIKFGKTEVLIIPSILLESQSQTLLELFLLVFLFFIRAF